MISNAKMHSLIINKTERFEERGQSEIKSHYQLRLPFFNLYLLYA